MANIFAIPDFWPTSEWLEELPQDDTTPFFDSKLRDISKDFNPLLSLDSVVADQHGFFKAPGFQSPGGEKTSTPEATEDKTNDTEYTAESGNNTELGSDIWEGHDQPMVKKETLKTWESFISGKPVPNHPLFLTEAGPSAYDALLSWAIDPLELGNQDVIVVEAKTYFASLLALALGRESILFLKTDDDKHFRAALPRLRIPGYSAQVLGGLEKQALTSGTRILELRAWIQKTYTEHTLRCGVALASALDEVLRAVQQNVVTHGQNPRSLLHLQYTVRNISAVIEHFYLLTSKLPRKCSDDDIVALVFDHAYAVDNSDQWLREIMQEVLRRVSRPWTEFLEEWIGTKREDGMPFTKASVGEIKGFIRVQAQIHLDDFGEEVEDVDFRLDGDKMPHFMPDDVTQSIFETGRNLRFIRSSHPNHPLSRPDVLGSLQPPKADWLYDWDSILQLEVRVTEYRDRLLHAVQESRAETRRQIELDLPPSQFFSGHQLDVFTQDEGRVEERILASIAHLSSPTSSTDTEGSLGRIIRQYLCNTDCVAAGNANSTPHWSLIPVLSFAGIVSAQAQVVNRETLRLLFGTHNLRNHLKLLRDYHLLGNGTFCSRLSQALFDPDVERADRQVGVARQGGVMGLRLGGRDTWPPASSELRLGLMGVLAESYSAENPNWDSQSKSLRNESPDLPGDLSFAVRDLSEEEVNKCMNPDSLEALDFLRLSYKAPSELGFIITPMALMQYDRIFKLLLRVLRVMYVVDQLWREVMVHREKSDQVEYRFVREARHFVSTIASYFLDVGVAGPWQAFENKLDKIQSSLDSREEGPDSLKLLESPEQLRDFHSNILHSLMVALFLRKRQEPVLKLLEEIFTIVLQYAKYTSVRATAEVNSGIGPAQLYVKFKKRVNVFITVCRGLTEKGRMGSTKEEMAGLKQDGIGDESIVAQLLLKLDIGGYYSRH